MAGLKKRKEDNDSIKNSIKKAEKGLENELKFNVPNSITLLRLILTFVFVYMLFMNYSIWILFAVFVIAALTDWFDGKMARLLNQGSKGGARLDQVVDRVFTAGIVISIISYVIINNSSSTGILTLTSKNIYLLLFLSISREIIGLPGFLIALIRNKDPYEVKYIGKLTTFVQSVTLAGIIIGFPFTIYLAAATCILGIISGFNYLKYTLS